MEDKDSYTPEEVAEIAKIIYGLGIMYGQIIGTDRIVGMTTEQQFSPRLKERLGYFERDVPENIRDLLKDKTSELVRICTNPKTIPFEIEGD